MRDLGGRLNSKPGWLAAIGLFCFSSAILAGDWPTFGHDPQRTGWAIEETTLGPQNVARLVLKWRVQLKNQPLSLTALTAPVVADRVITPQGVKTVVYEGRSAGEVVAVDAASGTTIWSRELEMHVLPKDETMWLCPNNLNATPVIDRRTSTIYAIANDGRLWGLDLGTGDVKFGPAQFVPPYSKNWSLNLHGYTIYTSISQGCGGAQSGLYSMDVRDPRHPVLRQLFVSKGGQAGIWGRGGPVIGRNNRVYGSTGDGRFDPAGGYFGSSIFAATLEDLEVADFFAPTNYQHVTDYDLDMAAASPVWFAAGGYHLLAGGGKEGVLYLLDADSLGKRDHHTPLATYKLSNDEATFQGKGIWGALGAWRDDQSETWLYVPTDGPVSHHAPTFPITNGPTPHGCIMAFKVKINDTSKEPALEPAWISGDFDLPDPPVVANGVLFALSTGENPMQTTGAKVVYSGQRLLKDMERESDTHNATLYALDAKTGKTLYRSEGAFHTWVHFSGLGLANGQVYAVDHDSYLYCFGLK